MLIQYGSTPVKNSCNMQKIKMLIALVAICVLPVAELSAQSVGLVMSGGGAKGLYHIGVIKALEENNIPIDYVSGTSMGSIIGGLYAIGYSPKEMEEIFKSGQVMLWLSGKIEDRYIYFYKRMHQNAAMFTLRFDTAGRKMKPYVPPNLLSSTQLDMAFVDFFAPATELCDGDFNRLFVPFRCVATDAKNRREIVYNRGDLGRAIRASMSLPLVFRPLINDTTVLYDGGIYNNFPWEVLEEDFHPDILIGSKCVEGNATAGTGNLMDEISALTMMHTDYDLPTENGIMIDRVFDDVSMLDFGKASYIIEQGYQDAMQAMPEILERIGRRVDPEELALKRLTYRSMMPNLVFDRYEVTGLNERQRQYVRKMMRLDGKKSIFDFDDFRSEYFRLMSDEQFEGSYPTITYNDTTEFFEISMRMHTKPSFKIMFGGNLSSTALNQAYVGLEYRTIGRTARCYNFDGYFSAFYSSVGLTGRTDLFLKLPFYYEYGFQFNYYNYFRSDYGKLSRSDLTFAKYVDNYFHFSIGTPVGRSSVLNLRLNAGRDDYKYYQHPGYVTDVDTLDRTTFTYLSTKLELERSTLNYKMYPTRGIAQSISIIGVAGREEFRVGNLVNGATVLPRKNRYWYGLRFRREHYFPVRPVKWFSWGYMIEGLYTSHPSFYNDYATNMSSPAFTPTPHSNIVYMKEFRSKSFIGFGLMPTFEFDSKFYLKSSVYAYLPENYKGMSAGVKQRIRYIFNASLVYQTFIGPISLTLSKYDTSRDNWFFTFNFGYALFNKKGLFY